MIIAVGSTNAAKVQAVEESLRDYLKLQNVTINAISSPSLVSDQPLSLEETVQGAKNRATFAFKACDGCHLSFGIECGLFQAMGTQTGYLNVCVSCIYTGDDSHIGFSTGFEIPPQALELVIQKKMDLSQACLHSGITDNANIGSEQGLIGILTRGRIDRKAYTKESLIAAMLQLENAAWYSQKKQNSCLSSL